MYAIVKMPTGTQTNNALSDSYTRWSFFIIIFYYLFIYLNFFLFFSCIVVFYVLIDYTFGIIAFMVLVLTNDAH